MLSVFLVTWKLIVCGVTFIYVLC